MNQLFWFLAEEIELLTLLEVSLKSVSIWVVLRFSEWILERWRSAIASRWNVIVLECWSRCPPRWCYDWTHCPCWITKFYDVLHQHVVLSLCVVDLLRSSGPWSIVSLLNTGVFRQITNFITLDVISCCPDVSETQKFFVKPFSSDAHGTFTFNNKHILHVLELALIDHEFVLGLVGLVGRTLRVELLLETVEQLYILAVDQL